MTEHTFNSSKAKRGVIRLPGASSVQYPIKITAVHVLTGTTFKAGKTPLFSAMDANGKTFDYSHDVAGEVIRSHITDGDILTHPKDAFDVWLYERNSTESAPKTQAPSPSKASQKRVTDRKKPRRAKKKWSETLLGAMFLYIGSGALLVTAFIIFSLWEEGDRHRAFLVPLATKLFYYGETYDTRTDGFAVLSIPLPQSDDGPRQYREVECPLTLSEYDVIANTLKRVGEIDYAQWFIYKARLFNNFECEFSSNQNWQLIEASDVATTIGILDIRFLFALKDYDSAE